MDVLEAMSSLVDKSLLRCRDATAEDPRFEMLEIVREYALERLAKSGDEKVTRRAHAAYSLVLAEEGAQAISGGADAAATLARFDQELPNLRASLDYLIADRQCRVGHAPRDGAAPVLAAARAPRRGARSADRGAGARGSRPRRGPGALYAASLMSGEQGDGAATRPLLEESVALYRELGDARAALVAQNALAVACQLMGDLQAARTHLEEVLQEARERGDAANPGARRSTTSRASPTPSGNPREAVRLYEQCREDVRGAGRPPGRRLGARPAGRRRSRRGRPGRGARALRAQPARSSASSTTGGGVATALTDLARLARREGDLETARRRCDEVLALGRSARTAPRRACSRSSRRSRRPTASRAARWCCSGRGGAARPAGLAGARLGTAGSERLIEEQKNALGNAAAARLERGLAHGHGGGAALRPRVAPGRESRLRPARRRTSRSAGARPTCGRRGLRRGARARG